MITRHSNAGRRRRNRRTRGFTLTEIMVAMAIALVVVGLATTTMIHVSRAVYTSALRLELNSKIRFFTDRFAKETIDANAFFILRDYSALDGSVDLIGEDPDSAEINKPVGSSASGDCLVLEYRDNPDNRSAITRVRVYYRDTVDIDKAAAVRRIDIDVPSGSQSSSLNEIVNALVPDLPGSHASHAALVSYEVHGIVPTDETEVQPIFFNHAGRAVSVNFRMQTAGTDDGPSKKSASAYNFTISPRR